MNTATATLSNGERIVRVLGQLGYARDVERADPEPVALLYPDLTVRDADRLERASKAAGDESEWTEDFCAAVRWNRRHGG